MGTFGSMTTRMFGPALRAAAAEARAVLTGLGGRTGSACSAEQLPCAAASYPCGMIPARQVSYGELARRPQIMRRVDAEGRVAAAADSGHGPLGRSGSMRAKRSLGRRSMRPTSASPGMLYARILRPPAHGRRLRSLDTSAAEAGRCHASCSRDDLVAVLHADPKRAAAALAALKAQWQLAAEATSTRRAFSSTSPHAGAAPDG